MRKHVQGARMFRGRSRLALVVCAVLAFVSPGAAAAQPAASADEVTPANYFNASCDNGEFCLYKDINRGLPVIDYGTSLSDGIPPVWRTCDATYVNNNFPYTGFPVNDQASSWWNRTSVTVRIYDDSGYIGDSSDLEPGTWGNLANERVGGDDASAHRSIGSHC